MCSESSRTRQTVMTRSFSPRYSLPTQPAKYRTETRNLTRSSSHGDIQTTARLCACLPPPAFSLLLTISFTRKLAMAHSIHISTARTMLNSGDPVDISVWKSDGSILELCNVISLRYSFYDGWRNVKILSSGECRKISDCCIFRVNDLEIFL